MKLNSSKKILMAVLLAVILTGCVTQTTQDKTIKIGLSAPLTGPVSLYGQWAKQGAQLATQHLNAKDGINGKQIKLYIEDDKCQAKKGKTTVNKLVNIHDLNKVIVFCGAVTPAVAPITQGKALTYSISVLNKPLIGKYPHLFNMPPSVKQEMNKLAHEVQQDGINRVAILHQSDHFGQTYDSAFTQAYNSTVVLSASFSKFNSADLRTTLTKAKQRGAEAIITSFNPPNLANLIQQKVELGYNVSIYGPWLAQTKLVPKQVGPAANGLTYTYAYKPQNNTKAKRFTQDYKRRYGTEPEMMAAYTYDAVTLLANVTQRCNNEVDCMIKATENISNYTGVSGTFSFNDKHTTTREVYIKQLINGTFQYE